MIERPILFSGAMVRAILEGKKTQTRRVCKVPSIPEGNADTLRSIALGSPYGRPGDRLWVRETMGIDSVGGRHYRATTAVAHCVQKWKPSIFMLRNDCRITLEVTGVRVERVQEITEDDAAAEGVHSTGSYFCMCKNHGTLYLHAKDAYMELWDSINSKRGYGWDVNPWVWVVEFRLKEGGAK